MALYQEAVGRVSVPLDLAPHATAVLMFRKSDKRVHVTSTTADIVVATAQRC